MEGRALEPEESNRLLRGWMNHPGPGKGVSADLPVLAVATKGQEQRAPGSPPRRCLDGKPELTPKELMID